MAVAKAELPSSLSSDLLSAPPDVASVAALRPLLHAVVPSEQAPLAAIVLELWARLLALERLSRRLVRRLPQQETTVAALAERCSSAADAASLCASQ